MECDTLIRNLNRINSTVSIENILDNSRADSGGERDVNFLNSFLTTNSTSRRDSFKKTIKDFNESYFQKVQKVKL